MAMPSNMAGARRRLRRSMRLAGPAMPTGLGPVADDERKIDLKPRFVVDDGQGRAVCAQLNDPAQAHLSFDLPNPQGVSLPRTDDLTEVLQAPAADFNRVSGAPVSVAEQQKIHCYLARPQVVVVGGGDLRFHEITRIEVGNAVQVDFAIDVGCVRRGASDSAVRSGFVDQDFNGLADLGL